MRFRSLTLLLLPLTAAVPAQAATIYLKAKADGAAGQPVTLTVKVLSHGAVTLPAEPVVYVDEGQGWKARPDVHCRLANTETGLSLQADREYTGTCELALPATPRLRVRVGYRHGEALSTSNAVTLPVTAAATARAAQ